LGAICFDYNVVRTAISQREHYVPDVDHEAMIQLRDFVAKSTAKVIVMLGVPRERVQAPYSFWLKIANKNLEAEYRLAMENQLQVVLDNAARIRNVINNFPIEDVGPALTQYGFDVDMSTSFKSFASAYRAVTLFGYSESQILPAQGILRVVAQLCATG
jgi:hypothetical protein